MVQRCIELCQAVVGPIPTITMSGTVMCSLSQFKHDTLPMRVLLSSLLLLDQLVKDILLSDPIKAISDVPLVAQAVQECQDLVAAWLQSNPESNVSRECAMNDYDSHTDVHQQCDGSMDNGCHGSCAVGVRDGWGKNSHTVACGRSGLKDADCSLAYCEGDGRAASSRGEGAYDSTSAKDSNLPPDAAALASSPTTASSNPQPSSMSLFPSSMNVKDLGKTSNSSVTLDSTPSTSSDPSCAMFSPVLFQEGQDIRSLIRPWASWLLLRAIRKDLIRVNAYSPSRHNLLLAECPYLSYSDGATVLITLDDDLVDTINDASSQTPTAEGNDAVIEQRTERMELASLGYWAYGRRLGERDKCWFPSGRKLSLRASCLRALHLDICNAYAYNGLAFSIALGSNEKVTTHDGRCYTAIDLYMKAISLNPNYCHPYYNLGYIQDNDVLMHGQLYSRKQLYIEALRCDPNYLFAYYNLAYNMGNEEMANLKDGRSLNRKQLYIEALRCDPKYSYSYNNLANLLGDDEQVMLSDGRVLNASDLYVEAIHLDRNYTYAFNNLANNLFKKGSVTLKDGREMTDRDLYREALRCDPSYSYAYNNLGMCLQKDESITLHDGRRMSKMDLFLESLRLDPNYESPLTNIVQCLRDGETIRLPDGRIVGSQGIIPPELFEQSMTSAIADLVIVENDSEILSIPALETETDPGANAGTSGRTAVETAALARQVEVVVEGLTRGAGTGSAEYYIDVTNAEEGEHGEFHILRETQFFESDDEETQSLEVADEVLTRDDDHLVISGMGWNTSTRRYDSDDEDDDFGGVDRERGWSHDNQGVDDRFEDIDEADTEEQHTTDDGDALEYDYGEAFGEEGVHLWE